MPNIPTTKQLEFSEKREIKKKNKKKKEKINLVYSQRNLVKCTLIV